MRSAASRAEGTDPFSEAREAAAVLSGGFGTGRLDAAVFVGSGWGPAVDGLGSPLRTIDLESLGVAAMPGVAGHRRDVALVEVEGRAVLCVHGRLHLYEGHHPHEVVHLTRAVALAGCRNAIVTNASGSLRDEFGVGDFVSISDHINLTGASPLAGSLGTGPDRFVNLVDAYSPLLRALAREQGEVSGEGVYAAVHGPQLETPAEVRMLKVLGADLVGMSTVMDVIALRQLGVPVLGLSMVTNRAVERPPVDEEPNHFSMEELQAVASGCAPRATRLLASLIGSLPVAR